MMVFDGLLAKLLIREPEAPPKPAESPSQPKPTDKKPSNGLPGPALMGLLATGVWAAVKYVCRARLSFGVTVGFHGTRSLFWLRVPHPVCIREPHWSPICG